MDVHKIKILKMSDKYIRHCPRLPQEECFKNEGEGSNRLNVTEFSGETVPLNVEF